MGFSEDQSVQRQSATHMLHAIFMMKAAIEGRVQARAGILLADNEALLNLAHVDNGLRMTEIAERLILSKGGTTKVIDRLEAKGLVRRLQDPSDRRALLVEITDDGRDKLAIVGPVVDDAIEEYWGQHVSNEEATASLDLADRIIAANAEWLD